MSSATLNAPARDARRWWLLAGVWFLYASFGLAATSLAPLVPYVREDLSLSAAAMGLVLGVWQFVYIGAAVPGGILLDRAGSRVALTAGALVIAASLLCRGLADGFYSLVGAVMLFGIGGPVISAGAPKVVTGLFRDAERGLAMGIYMTGPAIGGIVSLTMTHSLLLPALGHSWRNIMFLWAGVAASAAVAWWVLVTRTGDPTTSTRAASGGRGQLQVFRLIAREPAVIVVLLMSVGVFMFNHGLNNWLPELLRHGGMTLTEAGYWAAIPTVVGIAGSLLIPRLATPDRRFRLLIALALSAAAASVLLQFQATPAALLPGLLLQGVARSSLMTILILTLVELPAIGEKYAGVASGFFFSAAEVGGVMGPVALGLFYDATGGFGVALAFLTLVALLTAAGGGMLQRLSARPEASPAGLDDDGRDRQGGADGDTGDEGRAR